MTDIQILKKARKLIEKGWCRHIDAKDKKGKAVSPFSKEASRFCALGALKSAQGYDDLRLLSLLERELPEDYLQVALYNDCVAKDKRYILRLYDRTIKKLEGK